MGKVSSSAILLNASLYWIMGHGGKKYKNPHLNFQLTKQSYLLIHQFLSFELMEIRYKIFN